MRWRDTFGRPVTMTLAASVAMSAWFGGPMAAVAQAAPADEALVEDFAYPDRDKLLAEKGLKLVSGDGNIMLADCKSDGGLVRINSRTSGDVCFAVSGATGYLSMEIERTYLAKSDDGDVVATVRTDDPRTNGSKVEKVDLEPGKWKSLGEGLDPKLSSTLLELSVGQGKPGPELSGDSARPWLARVTVNQPGHKGGRNCSAALVDSSWILTAAGCFSGSAAKSALGEGAPKGSVTAVFAGKAPVKINYLVPRDDRDVVLARLATPVSGITPATLAGSAPADGTALEAAGYGRSDTAWVPRGPHASRTTQAKATDTEVELTGGRMCKGDAGGPIVDGSGRITAVQSRADHAGCLGQSGEGKSATAARTDNITEWLDAGVSSTKDRFSLDEAAGSRRVSGGASGEVVAELGGGAESGAAGKSGSALRLDGTSGFAATTGPVVDTTKSFSVAAWVKLDDKDKNYTFLSQAGDRASGFQVYYSQHYDKWVLNRHATDTDDTKIVRAMSKDVAKAGAWTHLAGSYDAAKQTLSLFVNGKLQESVKFTTPWRAKGGLQLGRLLYKGAWAEHAHGLIDDVRTVQSPVAEADVAAMSRGELPAHLKELASFSLDEGVGSRRVSGGVPGEFAAVLGGGAELGAAGKSGSALRLDGTSGFAATAGPVVDTTKSFSVAAWVKLDDKDRNYTFLSQAGDRASGFQVYYSKAYDRWVFNRHATDTDDTKIVRAVSKDVAKAGEWTHLAGSYDAAKQSLSLFVDGRLQESVKFTAPWRAEGGLQLGRLLYKGVWAEHAQGLIDDVRTVQSPVAEADVAALSRGEVPGHVQELASFALDEARGSVRAGGGKNAGAVASVAGGGAELGVAGKVGTALHLDGTSGFAATAGPVVDTAKSFSVSAWVKLDNKDGN
ncbi:LamG-like jellyroll fold domain-containing protein, partial [Streptomyces sp. NPDC059788]|uniref:LamG-like jellyroll fold domain-containing protein n=1 Tax=Streptomyces sp. NPDC059788 TaxID=3346948 RepID=UPI00365FE596